MPKEPWGFYEFFAGGGMARLGLGSRWLCLMANDICEKKARSYRENFGEAAEFIQKDVQDLALSELPGEPLLVWASFPCQDLSLAGTRGGLDAERSGTFWPFWGLIENLAAEDRAAPLILLENVVGAITSNRGRDLQAILEAAASSGYIIGPMVIDAVHFVPQSRPRLFLLAIDARLSIPFSIMSPGPTDFCHPRSLRTAYSSLPKVLKDAWAWWNPSPPYVHRTTLTDLIEENPSMVEWHSPEQTRKLLNQMSEVNLRKVREAQSLKARIVGTIYRRTRRNERGERVQRAEVRFDQTSGCLRTPVGGSSRQMIMVVEGSDIRTRLLSPREAARLMGVPDSYKLPENYNEAYHLMGDSLVVPVVEWLERKLLSPLAKRASRAAARA